MRIRICAEQVRLGCSKTKCSMSAATSEAAMWTSASGALGLEQERRDQEEMRIYDGCRTVNTTERNCTFPSSFSASSCTFTGNGVSCRCRETARCRCEGAGDVDAERDECIKMYTGARSRRRRRRDATGMAADGRRTWGGTGARRRHSGMTGWNERLMERGHSSGCSETAGGAHGVEAGKGRDRTDGTGLAGRDGLGGTAAVAGNAGAGFGQGCGGGVDLTAEDGGRRAWQLGHGRAARVKRSRDKW
jgi:hypothetical protein